MTELLQAPITLALFLANILAFIAGVFQRDFIEQNSLWIGPMRTRGEWYRVVTSGFLHRESLHLTMNLFGLMFAGPPLEIGLGPARFLLIYFVSLIGGSLMCYLHWRNHPQYQMLGASGAIFGLVFSIALFAPFETVKLFAVYPMWNIALAAFYLLLSEAIGRALGANVSTMAHIGGAIGGALITLLLVPSLGPNFFVELARVIAEIRA